MALITGTEEDHLKEEHSKVSNDNNMLTKWYSQPACPEKMPVTFEDSFPEEHRLAEEHRMDFLSSILEEDPHEWERSRENNNFQFEINVPAWYDEKNVPFLEAEEMPATTITTIQNSFLEKKKGKKKVQHWSEEEHRRFLKGIEKYGKGNWKLISREFVRTRSPMQTATHAQKYFLKINETSNQKNETQKQRKRKRRE